MARLWTTLSPASQRAPDGALRNPVPWAGRVPARSLGGQRLLPAGARRHRFADIRDIRNRRATSQPLVPASISSAAARHLLAAGPFRGCQPAAIGVPHGSGAAPAVTRASPPS
jgi:hypothetical protein